MGRVTHVVYFTVVVLTPKNTKATLDLEYGVIADSIDAAYTKGRTSLDTDIKLNHEVLVSIEEFNVRPIVQPETLGDKLKAAFAAKGIAA